MFEHADVWIIEFFFEHRSDVSFPTLQTPSLSEGTHNTTITSNPETQFSFSLNTLSETHLTHFTATLICGFLPRKHLRPLPGNRSQGLRARSLRHPSEAWLSDRVLHKQWIHRSPDKKHRQKGTRRAQLQPPQEALAKVPIFTLKRCFLSLWHRSPRE